MTSIPHFEFNLSSHNAHHYGFVMDRDEVICHINDEREFLADIGYPKEHNGLLADEFLWREYRKDDCTKSALCLQGKIIEYLTKHSSKFNDDYFERRKEWMGCCLNEKLMDKLNCTNCLFHSSHKVKDLSS